MYTVPYDMINSPHDDRTLEQIGQKQDDTQSDDAADDDRISTSPRLDHGKDVVDAWYSI